MLSYLSDRVQAVNINGCSSQRCVITGGVVRASVLGPLLCFVHINNILKIDRFGAPILIADGIRMVYSFEADSFDSPLAVVNRDLYSLEN